MLVPLVLMLALLAGSVLLLSNTSLPVAGTPLAVLGSGGHTGEMLAMLSKLEFASLDFVYGRGDALSVTKARNAGFSASKFYELPRARRVGEGKLSSAFSVISSLLVALKLVWNTKPRLILVNGPATALVVVLAARCLRLGTKVVYIESLARVKHLSLSGNIIWGLDMADRFVVQWPELAEKYPGTQHIGVLV